MLIFRYFSAIFLAKGLGNFIFSFYKVLIDFVAYFSVVLWQFSVLENSRLRFVEVLGGKDYEFGG